MQHTWKSSINLVQDGNKLKHSWHQCHNCHHQSVVIIVSVMFIKTSQMGSNHQYLRDKMISQISCGKIKGLVLIYISWIRMRESWPRPAVMASLIIPTFDPTHPHIQHKNANNKPESLIRNQTKRGIMWSGKNPSD